MHDKTAQIEALRAGAAALGLAAIKRRANFLPGGQYSSWSTASAELAKADQDDQHARQLNNLAAELEGGQ